MDTNTRPALKDVPVVRRDPQLARHLQVDLLMAAREKFNVGAAFTPALEEAFLKVPRHLFVEKFRELNAREWVEIDPRKLDNYLPVIYRDAPLIIHGEIEHFFVESGRPVSTVSQPSFVMHLLNLLSPRLGESVFELGTGSGWNAALLARLVGPAGQIVSYEIIPELAERARARFSRMGFRNVEVITGDGTLARTDRVFDKGIFTAGAFDLPRSFYAVIRRGGHLLFVLKRTLSPDLVILLERTEFGFSSRAMLECGFVPVTGRLARGAWEPRPLREVLADMQLNAPGSRMALPEGFDDGAVDFLSLHDSFVTLEPARYDHFAWMSTDRKSLIVVDEEQMITYGSHAAMTELLDHFEAWRRRHSPDIRSLRLDIYPRGAHFDRTVESIVSERPDSIFVWENKL